MNGPTEFWTRLQLFIEKDYVNVGTLHYTFGSVKFSSSLTIKQVTYTKFTSQNPSPIDSDLWGINELQKQESQNAVNVGTSNGDLKEIHVTTGGMSFASFRASWNFAATSWGNGYDLYDWAKSLNHHLRGPSRENCKSLTTLVGKIVSVWGWILLRPKNCSSKSTRSRRLTPYPHHKRGFQKSSPMTSLFQ